MIEAIKSYTIKNWMGVTERIHNPGKVNIISGHKGAGKTSLIEGFEMAITGKLDGKDRRTELIRHNEKEATLFVELTDGLIIDRRIRAESSNYLKVSKEGESVPSTEGFLRSLISGDIFRPGEFLKKKPEEQAAIILNMLEIPWSKEDMITWFGEVPEVNFDMHILKILKQIEAKYYEQRTAVNQQIDVLKAQSKGYKDQLPANYKGDEWRNKKVAEYYIKVTDAENINKKILAAQNTIQGLQDRIDAINANAELDKQVKRNNYERLRADGREYIQFLQPKIDTGNTFLSVKEQRFTESKNRLEVERQAEIQKINTKYDALIISEHQNLKNKDLEVDLSITEYRSKIAIKGQEISHIDALEAKEIETVDVRSIEQIKTADIECGGAKETLETLVPVDVEPIRKEAETVTTMREYLRDYDLMQDILLNKLAPRQQMAATLTARIDKARALPLDLLKISKCPIEGVTVDSEGMLRINGTLLDGLSDGEMKELAVKIAKNRAEAGKLKIICFDGFQDLNPAEQKKIIKEAKTDGFQWFFLVTSDSELKIEILDDNEEGGYNNGK